MEFLCNNFTLEEHNLKDEFLSHPSSSLITNPNQYYDHNYPSNELFPISNYYQNDVLYDPNDSISSQTTNESCDHNSHFSSLLQNDACFSIDDICMMNQTNFEPLDYVFSSGLDHVLGNVHQGLVEDDESINYLGSSYTSLVTQDNLEEASPKKKARLYKDNRGKKSIEFRKDKKENESNSKSEGEILEDESKTTLESNEPKSWASKETCKGKKRASRGAATDPQSLYARRRREKINERLRILQNLIPNGTKVDISTMLEEASHYVKFLQLQIQLLSSDELWMYAPIAYNGVDITHYKRISPFLLS